MTDTVTVLLVEDEGLISAMLADALEEAGYAVVAAASGAAAITMIDDKKTQFAAIVADIRLGKGPTGWDVVRHARERDARIPVVYMTADSENEWSARGVPNSVLVPKPFAATQIITAVATMINEAAARAVG